MFTYQSANVFLATTKLWRYDCPEQQKVRSEAAATIIQAVWRGRAVRLHYKKLINDPSKYTCVAAADASLASDILQMASKAWMKKSEKLRMEKLANAAMVVQSVWRGRAVRLRLQREFPILLDYALFKGAKSYLRDPERLQKLPQALNGDSKVYLPRDLPVVIKLPARNRRHDSKTLSNQRYTGLFLAHALIKKNHFMDLVVPRARVCGEWIIESRVPIEMHNTKEQIGLYCQNSARFTNAVVEFFQFTCQSEFDDIVGEDRDPFSKMAETPIGCYDNCAFLQNGKLGLVDLERFRLKPVHQTKSWCLRKCQKAVYMFPLHLETILAEAKKHDRAVERHRKSLETSRDKVLKFFDIVHFNHLRFLQEGRITSCNPAAMRFVTDAAREAICQDVVSAIKKHCLRHSGENDRSEFERRLNLAITLLISQILAKLAESIKKTVLQASHPIDTEVWLMHYRTLYYNKTNSEMIELMALVTAGIEQFRCKKDKHFQKFADYVFDAIFKAFMQRKAIAYYTSNMPSGIKCIFS